MQSLVFVSIEAWKHILSNPQLLLGVGIIYIYSQNYNYINDRVLFCRDFSIV